MGGMELGGSVLFEARRRDAETARVEKRRESQRGGVAVGGDSQNAAYYGFSL